MTKPVSLSVHRNTAARRERHRISKEFMSDARALADDKQISGFAVVTWNKDFGARCRWDCNGTMSGNVMPEFVKRALERSTGKTDANDVINDVFFPDNSA